MTPEQYKKLTRARYNADKPKPLPKRRKREELTPPPDLEGRREKRHRKCNTQGQQHDAMLQSQQEDCMLLQHLPSEIRLYIWELVLGGEHFHMECDDGKLHYRVCPGHLCERKGRGCRQDKGNQPDSNGVSRERRQKHWSKLNMLRTCRQIYSEAIDILYTHNTFSFSGLRDPHFMRLTTLPKRFELIRSALVSELLSQEFYDDALIEPDDNIPYPTPQAEWDTGWKAIRAMSGLRKLRFTIMTNILYRQPRTLIKTFETLKGLNLDRNGFEINMRSFYGPFESGLDAQLMEEQLNARGLKCRVGSFE